MQVGKTLDTSTLEVNLLSPSKLNKIKHFESPNQYQGIHHKIFSLVNQDLCIIIIIAMPIIKRNKYICNIY